MKRICVFAGSNSGLQTEYVAAAQELGRVLAGQEVGLVYGGARVGLMGALADAVLAARGHVTGVIPEALVAKEVAHNGLSELRVVASMHARKAVMADLADGFIALPGGWGTLEEFFEVLTWAQLGLHQKPCGLLNVRGFFDGLLSFIDHSINERFVRRENRSMVIVSSSPGTLLELFDRYVPTVVEKMDRRRLDLVGADARAPEIGTVLVRCGVRYHTRAESISKRAPSTCASLGVRVANVRSAGVHRLVDTDWPQLFVDLATFLRKPRAIIQFSRMLINGESGRRLSRCNFLKILARRTGRFRNWLIREAA